MGKGAITPSTALWTLSEGERVENTDRNHADRQHCAHGVALMASTTPGQYYGINPPGQDKLWDDYP